MDTEQKDLRGSYSFSERVTADVFFDEFDPGNAAYRGRARVRYKEHIEEHLQQVTGSHVEWTKDVFTDRVGSGDVECTLYYPWGQEDATYHLSCDHIEIQSKTYEIVHYTSPPEVKEKNSEWTGTTDLDESHISSHYGGLPSRYDLVIEGQHLDEKDTQGRRTREFASWRFTLAEP
jgi:hypothetical protein